MRGCVCAHICIWVCVCVWETGRQTKKKKQRKKFSVLYTDYEGSFWDFLKYFMQHHHWHWDNHFYSQVSLLKKEKMLLQKQWGFWSWALQPLQEQQRKQNGRGLHLPSQLAGPPSYQVLHWEGLEGQQEGDSVRQAVWLPPGMSAKVQKWGLGDTHCMFIALRYTLSLWYD